MESEELGMELGQCQMMWAKCTDDVHVIQHAWVRRTVDHLSAGMLRLYSTLAKNLEGGGRIRNNRPRHECAQNILVLLSCDS